MEPDKFEQHIKEELNKREIQPSATAWDKISNQLDEPQKRKSTYLWWGIAASFAGLLIVSTLLFNSNESSVEDTTIVDTDNKKIEIKVDDNLPFKENVEETQIVNTSIETKENVKVLDKVQPIHLERPKSHQPNNEITQVIAVNPQLEIEPIDEFSKEKIIEQKIAEVIAKVDELELNNATVTDLEIDKLIQQAQQEILQNKIFRQNQTVDAMALLNEVEGELDKPLKDQLFDLLKKGIYETRNAIADRN